MIIQNVNGVYQKYVYATQTEKDIDNNIQIPSNYEYIHSRNKQYGSIDKHEKEDTTKISKINTTKNYNAPTKIYVDKVINNALNNISQGNNIEDNKRIVRIFSNLIRENPENMLRKAYNIQ